MLTNEEVRQIRDNTFARIEAENAELLRQQDEMHRAMIETYGPEGVDTYYTLQNAKAIVSREDAPDELLWGAAHELAKSYTRWMKMPLPTSPTLDDWNVERKPFANGREALGRIINLFDNPSSIFDDRYKTMAAAQSEGSLTPQSLVEMAQGAGYKAKELGELELDPYLTKEDREAFGALKEARDAVVAKRSKPGVVGPRLMDPEENARDDEAMKAYEAALPGFTQKAQEVELAHRYQSETVANNALALWASAAAGLSPASNELLRRAFIGGTEGIDIDNRLTREFIRHATAKAEGKGDIADRRYSDVAAQNALYQASLDSGNWDKVDNATLFSKIPAGELDSVLMLLGAARGTVRDPQWFTDMGRRMGNAFMMPIEGVADFFTFGFVRVSDSAAAIAKGQDATALDVMSSDVRQQIALRHALEDATAPKEYEDYGWLERNAMVALEQFPILVYQVGVPWAAGAVAGAFTSGTATAPVAATVRGAVMSAYAMSYAAETREYALREGASPLSANLMGIASGVAQSWLETSKAEMLIGKGFSEELYKAAMASASKRTAQILAGKVVGKYGSLELFKAALESGSAIAINGALETFQEGLQKAAEEVSKNVALKIDGKDVRLFEGVEAAVNKEMAEVWAGMMMMQGASATLSGGTQAAAGTSLLKNMAILRGGLFQAMKNDAPASESRLNLMNSPQAQQEMKAKWLGVQNASRKERVNMLMRDYGLSADEAMSVDTTMGAFKNIVNRNTAQAAQLIAEYVINGNSNIEPLLTQSGAITTVTNANLAERFKAAFAAIGITDVEIEEASGINFGEDNEEQAVLTDGKFVLKFGKGDVQYTFGINNDMGDPASAGFASSARQDMLRVEAPEANVSEVSFVMRWTQDEAFRNEMIKKYGLKEAGHYNPTRARLHAVDKDGNTYTADVDGIISLAIGERATTQTVVHETMHLLLRVVRDLEMIQGADSVMDEATKRTLLQSFSPNLLQQYDAARKAGKDNFFELFLAKSNKDAEEKFANLAMRGATTHNVTTAQEIISQSAKQNVSGAIDWLRMMGGKMLDAFLGTDEWRVVLDDNGLGTLVEGLTGDVVTQRGVSHVIDTLSQGVLNATKAQDAYHEAREQERKARWDREALKLRQRVAEAAQRKQAVRQQMVEAQAAEAEADRIAALEAEAAAIEAEIAQAEVDFNNAINERAAVDEALRERAQEQAARKVEQAEKNKARATQEFSHFYRTKIAPVAKGEMTSELRERLKAERALVKKAKQAYREAVYEAAQTGDPGAIAAARRLDIQDRHDKQIADMVTWLNGEQAVIDNIRISNWDEFGLTRVLGQFTLESKTSFIKNRMRNYGETLEQATAQADGLYPAESNLSAPWLNKELYGDGTGGSSPDTVAQAMYDEGRISAPDAEVLWEAIRGDVENLQLHKQREKDRVMGEFVEAVDAINEDAKRDLAYLEMEEDLGRYQVIARPSAEAVAQAQREYDTVVARYTNADGTKIPGWMKAPNGKPTNLTERQWVMVRTPSFKKWFGDWETLTEVKNAKEFLLNGQSVTTLVGNEFAPNGQKLTDRVPDFFNDKYGGFATSPVFGKVLLDKEGVADDIAHGLGRLKACAFAAVHDVIEHGVVYNKSDNWKGRGWKTAVIGAPIKIGQEEYICEVIVKRLPNRQGFYLHEVELKNKLEVAFKTPTKGSATSSSRLIIAQVLDNLPNNVSKVVDENGEPLVVYHGTESGGFTEFIDTDDIGYFFTSSFDMARSYSGERGVYAPSRISSWDEALKEAETFGTAMIEGYAVENVNGRMVADSFYPSQEEVAANLTLNKGDKVVKAYRIDDGYDEGEVFLEKELNEFVDAYARPQDAGLNYEVFLNLKDPLIVNGKGSNWDNVIDHVGTMVTYDELTDEQKERIAEEMGVDVDELEDYQVEDLPVFDIDNFDVRTPRRTRDWVSEAADMGCDGVIFKDIYDEGKFGYGTLSADVFVAMRANQIKSTENAAPTENDDIRYSVRARRAGANPNQMDLFADWLPEAELRRQAALAAIQRRGATEEERQAARDLVNKKDLVLPRDFEKTFGFNKVRISTPSATRSSYDVMQQRARELYNGMLAMCDALDIPYNALSLGNTLNDFLIEFKSPFDATTSSFRRMKDGPDTVLRAIYLKQAESLDGRQRDAATFYHEWFHFFDYIQNYGKDVSGFIPNMKRVNPDARKDRNAWGGDMLTHRTATRRGMPMWDVRPEVWEAFDKLHLAIQQSAYHKRIKATVGKGRAYWTDPVEQAAYLFAEWIDGVVLGNTNQRSPESRMPTTEEAAEVGPAFDALFKELKVGINDFTGAPTLYSVSARRPDLVGLHNMSAEGLKGADALGGFAMPSIAITRDSMGHNEFGDISLLMRTSAYDPKVNSKNKLYSRDAWTPTFPGIVNKANLKKIVKVSKRLLDTLPADVRKAIGHNETYRLLYDDGIQEKFASMSTAGDAYGTNTALKAAYLIAKGETVEPVMKPSTFLGRSNNRILSLGEYGLRLINETIGDMLIEFHSISGAERMDWIDQHASEIEAAFIDAAYTSRIAKKPDVAEFTKEEVFGNLFTKNPLGFADVIDLADAVDALRKAMAKGEADAQTVDEYATKRAIDERVPNHDPAFEAWLNEQYGDPILARGIRNNKEFYTPSGNRRSWDALHDPVTLTNVVKVMLSKQREQGGGVFGLNPFGVGAAKFKTFKDVIKNEELLKNLPQEEMEAIRMGFINAFGDISDRYLGTWEYKDSNRFIAHDNSNESLLEAWVDSKGTFAGLKRELNAYGRTASDELIRDFMELMNGIAKFPTTYFEAKPMRAVGFEEVAAAIIPDNTTEETREILKRRGVPVYEYTAGNDTSRLAALNMAADDVEGTRFSVTSNIPIIPKADFETYAKAHDLKPGAVDEMERFAVAAKQFSDEAREVWRRAFTTDAPSAWREAFATPEANVGNYPTVSRVIAENYKRPKGFSAKVKGLRIYNPEDIGAMMMAVRSPFQEMMKVVYVDANRRVLDARILTFGLVNQTMIESAQLFDNVPEGTVGMFVSHNHPSGNVDPSDADRLTTEALNAAANAMGIPIIDHIITNGTKCYSLRMQKTVDIPEAKQVAQDWEIAIEGGTQIITPGAVANVAQFLRQDGEKAVLFYLDKRNRIAAARLLPTSMLTNASFDVEQNRAILGPAFQFQSKRTILYLPDNDSTRFGDAENERRLMNTYHLIAAQMRGMGVELVDIIQATRSFGFISLRMEGKYVVQKGDLASDSWGANGRAWTRYAVSARPARLSTLPETARSAIAPTSLSFLTRGGHVDEQKRDYDYALKCSQSSEKAEAEKGDYMLAKYHNDGAAAARTILRAFHADSPEQFAKNKSIQALREVLKDGDGPVVFVPVTNSEGENLNALPKAYADILAAVLGGEVYDGVRKTSSKYNTNASHQARMANIIRFGDEGKLPEGARIVLVDDVYTSGATLRQMTSFIQHTYTASNIVAIATLATGRYGKGVIPTEATLQSVYERAKITPEKFKEITGYEADTYTEAEHAHFLRHSRSGGEGSLVSYYGKPGEREDLRPNDGEGALLLSGPRVSQGFGRGQGLPPLNRMEPLSASDVNFSVSARPTLTTLNEQHAASQARLAKAEKRMRKANASYHVSSQAAMRDTFGAMPNVNDMVSHPMLEYTMGAIAMERGHKVTPRDVQKFAKDFGLSVDARSAKESADRINESVWGKAGRASKMNKSLILRGKQRSPFERLSALGAILESEANEPDREKRVQDEMAKIMGYARGAQSARTVSRDARALREIQAQEILNQTGYSAETIEQWCGFDLVDTILEMQDALSRMSKADIEAVVERRQQAAEERKNRELEEAASGTELKSEITAEQQAIWEELQQRLVELTRERAALEEQRRQKAKERRQKQKEAAEDEASPKQEDGDIDLVEATEDLIPQSFDVGGRTIDLMEPADLVWFVENMVAYKMQQTAATEEDLATLSNDQKYIRNVAMTLGSVIERLANGMVYSLDRDRVMRAITDLGYAGTLRQVELIGIKALSTLHASRIRTQRKAIIKAMLEGGEVDIGSRTIELVGIKQAVADGRFVVGRSDLNRDVTGDAEANLMVIKKVIKAGDTEQARLEADARQKLEELGKTAGLDNEEIMRDYQDARRMQAALNTYGGLTHRTIAELVDIAEELSRQINGELEAHERRKAEAQAKHDADVQTVVAACAADAKKYKPTDDNKTWRERAADWLDRGNGLLNLVLDRIGRNATGDVRNAWSRLSNDIQAKFARSAQKERALIDGYNARVAEIMTAAYGSQLKGVNRLNELIPEDLNEIITAQIQRDKDGNPIPGKQAHQKTRMTVGQVLQLWLSIKQQDYKNNAVLWGRDGATFKAIESCLSAADIAFASQAQQLLKDIFPVLRDTYRNIVGYSVGTTPDYWPVKIHMERDSRPADVRVYSPFVAAMQPRTRHGLDFDESADALTMLTSRLNEYAHMQAYGEMAEEMVALFGDHKLRRAIKNAYGDEYMAQLDAKLQDTLLGPRMQYSAIGSNLVALTSVCSMGFNLNSVFKQLFSFGSMANRLGLRGVAKFFAENMFDFSSPEAEYLRNSTAWKSRYGKSTQNAVFEQLMRGTGKMSKASIVRNQIINAGFKPIMWADWLASRNVSLGFFKMRKAQLMDEGMAVDEAMERASVEAIDLIETTMQTGQTHHQSQAAKNEMYKLLSQFQNALVQQGEYMKVDVAKILRGERGGWEGLGRTAARYAVTGALIQMANLILMAIYGDGVTDDDDDEAKDAWYRVCAELVSSLFLPVTATPLVGGVATWAINYAVGESDTLNSYDLKNEFVPPAFSTIERTFSGAIDVGYAFAGEEDWTYALHKLGKATSAPYRSATRFAEGQLDWEAPKKQR